MAEGSVSCGKIKEVCFWKECYGGKNEQYEKINCYDGSCGICFKAI